MRIRSAPRRPALAALATLAALAALSAPRPALGQAGVFDDEKPAEAKAKAKDEEKKKDEGPSDRDKIGFTQENVASQMAELEGRMFRLSEALRGLEPENASRLRLALKFSREELILEQMKEAQAMLKDAQLAKAETEAKELLAKLEHLRDLLLAEDLDFQLKLARLRQMRESLGQLDRIIKDERRAQGWSRFAVEQRKEAAKLSGRRPDLEALARDQEGVIADAKAAAGVAEGADREESVGAVRDRAAEVRAAVAAAASDPLFADLRPAHLRLAATHAGDALARLEAGDAAGADEPGGLALASINDELARLTARASDAEKAVNEDEFRRHEADQAKVRTATDSLSNSSTRLGDAGIALQKDLIRAGGSMKLAEEKLARAEPAPASDDQSAALDSLTRSRDGLGQAAERLLVQLRKELQARLIAELTAMHETQAAIRESTEAQAPRVAKKSRTALIALANLSKTEGEMAEGTEHLLALVEETEFGIALPTALRVLGAEMRRIEDKLKSGDASETTVALEKRVEEDLLALLQAVRRLPPNTPPSPGDPLPSDLRQRERELNRLVAELKMIRLLQSRLNQDTSGVDKKRPGPDELPADVRQAIEELEAVQEELSDDLSQIAERIESAKGPN